jgi:eukaryotic-like serine/threonine-protein kinase
LSGKHPILTAPVAGPIEQLRALLEVEPRRLSEAVRDRPALAREQRRELDSILAKALQKPSGERYANAAAFADDVQRYLSHLPLQARADTFAYRTLKFTRRHRFGVAAAAALVLTLAGGVAATLQQALEVRAQQSKAEALIDFMLGDLRDKLQAVGRLDAMDAVGERALTYYDAQPSRLLDDAALGRRSRAMQLIGEIAELRGNFDQAATYFRSSAASTEARLRREPQHPPNIYNHAQSMYWSGYVAWKRGLLPEAKRDFDEYLGLTQQLVRIDASNVDWQIEEGYAHQNLGVLLLDRAEFAAALGALERGRQRFAAHVAQRPALRGTLLSSHGWIAKAKDPLGDIAGAVEEMRTQIELQRGQPDAGSNRRIQQAIAIGEADLARLELNRGDAAASRQHARLAVELLQALVAVDPANEFWAQQLAWSQLRRGEAERALSEVEAAQASLQSAQRSVDSLLAKSGGAALQQAGLAGKVLVARAELALQTGHAVPVAQVRDWLAARAADPLVSRMQYIAAQAHLVLGDAYSRGGDVRAARDQWEAGGVSLAGQTQADPTTLTVRAQLQARLGDSAGARELADRVARTDFKHPAYVELAARLAGIKVAAKSKA